MIYILFTRSRSGYVGRFVIRSVLHGFCFELLAGNYEPIASSGTYSSEMACRKGIDSVIKNALAARVEDQTKEQFQSQKNPKFEIYFDTSHAFRFRLKAKNGEVIAVSEPYKAKASCINGIKSVIRNCRGAEIVRRD